MKFKSCFGMSIDGVNHQHMHIFNGTENIEMQKIGNNVNYRREDVPKFEKIKVVSLDVKRLMVRANLSRITFVELPMAEKEMIIKFHGQGRYHDRKPTIDVMQMQNEIRIKEKYSGNSFVGNLAIDIIVPKGFMYNNVTIKTVIGDVLGYVRTKFLRIDTLSGDTQIRLDGKTFTVNTLSGNIEARFKARGKSKFNIDTVNGNVDLTLDNVSDVFVNGEKSRVFHEKYPLEIAYSNVNGSLKIR